MKSYNEIVSYKIVYTDSENKFKGRIEVANMNEFFAWVGEEKRRGNTIVINDIYQITAIRFKKNIFKKGVELVEKGLNVKDELLRKVRRA